MKNANAKTHTIAIAQFGDQLLADLQAAMIAKDGEFSGTVGEDDVGMLDADADDILGWCDDLEARIGLDVTAMRRTAKGYILARDGVDA